ncbi:hypothetical protein LPB248_06620 [Flavobacterium sp. LPB0248]|uniref:hypothetical protein n=1 Tax=Flavobacterium sp. LPB0248 TaxID=2614441 RepID=UPI0015A6BE30|nr:hypothetical protein [Flavobacterium sp. LPB0248]QLC65962.1 hypothetical protein LPB248_06620 [Flavobacterium sp. LPB0248]
MHYQLKIPENHPMREQLEGAITSLLTFVHAGTIYISNNGQSGLPIIVTFILKKNCGQCGDAVEKMAKKITDCYPDFIFKFINAFRASQGFKEGFPYLIRHCTIAELVYYQPDNKVFYPLDDDAKELLQWTKLDFKDKLGDTVSRFQKASADMKDNSLKEAGNSMCVALWDLYCCYSWLLIGEIGEDMGRPSLLYEYKMVVRFVPYLKEILNYDIPEDKEIIDHLSSAHTYYRDNTINIEINPSVLERAKVKFELLEKEFRSLFSDYQKEFKSKMKGFRNQSFSGQSILTEMPSSNYFIGHALSEISRAINGFMKTRAVFCFGYNTFNINEGVKTKKAFNKQFPCYHFYLLILSTEYRENALPLLQSLIKEKFENRYTATLLIHRTQNLRRQSHYQKYFLNKVMANGILAQFESPYSIYPINADENRDIEFTRNYWKNRMLACEQFLMTAEQCTEPDEALVKNALVQQAVQQVAVAQLDLFLSYHPAVYSIPYMFRLLECIPAIKLPFSDSQQDRKLIELLSANIDMIKHKDLNRESIDQSNLLYTKCEAFYNEMYTLGYTELQRLDDLKQQDEIQ